MSPLNRALKALTDNGSPFAECLLAWMSDPSTLECESTSMLDEFRSCAESALSVPANEPAQGTLLDFVADIHRVLTARFDRETTHELWASNPKHCNCESSYCDHSPDVCMRDVSGNVDMDMIGAICDQCADTIIANGGRAYLRDRRRNCTIKAHDRAGHWTITADGDAGTAYVVTNSYEFGAGIAAYYASFGEFPRGEWHAPETPDDVQLMGTPYAYSWSSESDAVNRLEAANIVFNSMMRRTSVIFAEYAPDDSLTDSEWAELDRYGHCFPASLAGSNRAVAEDSDGYARIVTIGEEYVNRDGSMFVVNAD